MVRINRFPKMLVLQYCRAIALGYSEPIARAIGIAQATKYAIYKNKSNPFSRNSRKSKINLQNLFLKKDKRLNLTFDNDYPVVAGKIYTEKDFDRYLAKFNSQVKEALLNWAKSIIEKTDKALLEIESRFFNKVWKQVRDCEI